MMRPALSYRRRSTSRRLSVCLIHQPWWGKPSICLGLLLLLLLCSSRSQNLITPEQAVQAVRDFWGDPTILATVTGFDDTHPLYPSGIRYEVTATNHPKAGMYHVRATDGVIGWFWLDYGIPEDEPTLTLEEAQVFAEQFLQQHYPAYFQGQWERGPKHLIRTGVVYQFCWYQVLNGFGTLSPYWIEVAVNGVTGAVLHFSRPTERITGPTVRHLTQAQAQQIAAAYATYDPAVVPFDPVKLWLEEDKFGVQRLYWELTQVPDPVDDPIYGVCIWIDALTGEFGGYSTYFSGPGGSGSPPLNPHRKPLPEPTLHLRSAASPEQPLRSNVGPRLERGRVWVRVELLRGCEARVETDAKGATVRVGERTIIGAAVGAKWREWGWWVPLRRTVQALGGRVDWLAARREAVVDLRARVATKPASK